MAPPGALTPRACRMMSAACRGVVPTAPARVIACFTVRFRSLTNSRDAGPAWPMRSSRLEGNEGATCALPLRGDGKQRGAYYGQPSLSHRRLESGAAGDKKV